MRRVTIRGLLARKLRLALTALAIVLGVMFVTGTLVLGDTLNRTFDNLVGTAYGKITFEIRGKAAFSKASASSGADRNPVPASIATAVRRLPGVVYAHGDVSGYAQFVDRRRKRDRRRRRQHARVLVRSQPAAVLLPAGRRTRAHVRRRRGDGQGDRDQAPLRDR